jgi:ABC-type polysaccharide/polyol phosphate export permease
MSIVQMAPVVRSFIATFSQRARELCGRWQTIRFLVGSNLKAGHRDKVLGHLWNLLDPLLFVGVYFVVFGLLFGQTGRGRTEFILYLSVGVLAWRFLEGTIAQATMCVRGNRGLIHEINFPKGVFPVSVCLSRLYDFLWGLLVLLPILVIAGSPPTLYALWVFPLVVLQVLFTIGVAFLVAYMGAFFADTANVVNVAMRLLMYASPTFYYVRGEYSLIPERYLAIYMLNPIACFFEGYRDALIYGKTPPTDLLLYVTAVSVGILLFGFSVFAHGEGKFAKYV